MAKDRRGGRRRVPDFDSPVVRAAAAALLAEPSYAALAALLAACREGHLVVDVTGSPTPSDARVRTISSIDGQRVLPVFTSVPRLRETVPAPQRPIARGAVMPGREALALVESADCAAVQFDPGHEGLVVQRRFVLAALAEAPPTAEELEALARE